MFVLLQMDAAVERLKTGFEKFKTDVYDKKPDFFEPLKAGQAPKVWIATAPLIISPAAKCCL
jgi:carbonic anhydrase